MPNEIDIPHIGLESLHEFDADQPIKEPFLNKSSNRSWASNWLASQHQILGGNFKMISQVKSSVLCNDSDTGNADLWTKHWDLSISEGHSYFCTFVFSREIS